MGETSGVVTPHCTCTGRERFKVINRETREQGNKGTRERGSSGQQMATQRQLQGKTRCEMRGHAAYMIHKIHDDKMPKGEEYRVPTEYMTERIHALIDKTKRVS